MKNVAGSGGKWLDVAPERLGGWVASFAIRHGESAPGRPSEGPSERPPEAPPGLAVAIGDGQVTFTAPDGAVARCHPPFPAALPALDAAAAPAVITTAIAAHAMTPRAVGVLLVRLGGYAAGVFTGYPPALADSKVGSRLVHGRSAAGGWSQHRFARRREKQVDEALAAAADAAVMIFGRATARLDAVAIGGDKRTFADLRDDARLAPYLALADDRFLTVPDPRRAVLLTAPRLYLAVRIWLTEPGPETAAQPADPPQARQESDSAHRVG